MYEGKQRAKKKPKEINRNKKEEKRSLNSKKEHQGFFFLIF
jgi:hypothetical protein